MIVRSCLPDLIWPAAIWIWKFLRFWRATEQPGVCSRKPLERRVPEQEGQGSLSEICGKISGEIEIWEVGLLRGKPAASVSCDLLLSIFFNPFPRSLHLRCQPIQPIYLHPVREHREVPT